VDDGKRHWHSIVGEPGGGVGIDHAFAEQHGPGIGAESMGRASSARRRVAHGPARGRRCMAWLREHFAAEVSIRSGPGGPEMRALRWRRGVRG